MSEVKNIPSDWAENTLGEVATFQRGFDLPTKDRTDGNYPLMVSNGQDGTHNEFKVMAPGIVTGRSGSLGNIFYVNENFWPLNTTLWIKDFHNNDVKFVYYFLKTFPFEKYNSGSGVPTLNRNHIHPLSIIFPGNINEQKSIASILTAFDDKIELLQQQNQTLETLAQTIYKEWFGKYQVGDLPADKAGELPEGWRLFNLSELVDVVNGYSYKGLELVQESKEALVTLKSFDRYGGFQTRGFKPFIGNPKPSQEVKIGDLVVAHTDLTQDAEVLGNPAFIFDDGGFNKMYITMDLVKVIPTHKDISSSFLYYLMKDRAFKGHCVGYSNGTTVLHLSKKAIPEYQLLLPIDFSLIKRFSELADSTTTKISLNKLTIKSLTQTRDTLLPKLMSGQVRVKI